MTKSKIDLLTPNLLVRDLVRLCILEGVLVGQGKIAHPDNAEINNRLDVIADEIGNVAQEAIREFAARMKERS